jgi:hypothetical protein
LLRHRRFTSDQPAAELKKSQMQHWHKPAISWPASVHASQIMVRMSAKSRRLYRLQYRSNMAGRSLAPPSLSLGAFIFARNSQDLYLTTCLSSLTPCEMHDQWPF